MYPRNLALASIAILFGSAANADLTTADIWADWQKSAEIGDYTLTATQTRSASGALTLSDIKLKFDDTEEEFSGSVSYGDYTVTLTEQDDGSVTFEMADETTVAVAFTSGETGSVSFDVDVSQAGAKMTASGEPEAIRYAYHVEKLLLAVDALQLDDLELTEDEVRIDFEIDDFSFGDFREHGDLLAFSQSATIATLAYDIFVDNAEADEQFSIAGQSRDIEFSGSSILSPQSVGAPMGVMLSEGEAVDARVSSRSGGYTITTRTGDDRLNFNVSYADGATLEIALDADGFRYDLSQNDFIVNALVSDLPIPFSLNAAKAQTTLRTRVQKKDDPQPFSFLLTLSEFSMSDVLWNLFDAGGNLPRDPATLNLDVSGQSTLLVDLLDEDAANDFDITEQSPVEVNEMTLNALEVNALGARLTGSGDLTFDNDDMATFDGFPRPEGALDFQLEGGNALLDTLVEMGFVQEMQAMSTRMMVGLFAEPGEGDDTLTSRIEINEQGHVLANGQRLR